MLKIHGIPISVHTRKVLVTANLKAITYENDPVIPFFPPEGWATLSPTGLIPAISHDGFHLADSNAICAYLERLAPTPSIYPAGAKALGQALWLEQYATAALYRQVFHPIFFQRVIRPRILKQGEPDEAEVMRVVTEVAPKVFAYLDSQAGDTFGKGPLGIADIAIGATLINYLYTGERLDTGRYPKLAAAFAQILRQPSFATALAEEKPFAEQMGLDRSFLS